MDSPAEVKEPIDWMLLTTVKTESFQDACQRLSWYSRRWGIEVSHRTLKSGCRIEDRRLKDTESLEACLAIDLVVAWRVHWLTRVGREKPNTACDQILKEEEWRVLSAWATGTMAEKAPSVQEATRWIGKMGGWREGDKTILAPPASGAAWFACQLWCRAISWLCGFMALGPPHDHQS